MQNRIWVVMVVMVALTVSNIFAAPPAAQSTAGKNLVAAGTDDQAEEYCGCSACDARKHIHDTFDWLRVGADLRLRAIYDNNRTLNKHIAGHERFWQRFRSRAWAKVTPLENLDFNVRLTWEWRNYAKPKGRSGGYTRDTDLDEALFDIFNVKLTEPLDQPLTAIVGRQEMKFGDGWLIRDGTPADGTRTMYFDAVRGTIDLQEYDSTLDLVYIDQASDTDRFIRPFGDQDRAVTEQNERGAIVYLTNKSVEDMQVDTYFIFKHDMKENGGGNDADIYTFGMRLAGDLDDSWAYRVEVAPQFGEKNNVDVHALGANSRLTYKLNDAMESKIFTDYEYRSGDSNVNNSFDILWGRTVQWSEIFNSYTDTLEGTIGRSTNLHRAGIGASCSPAEKVDLVVGYNLLFADRNSLSNGAAGGMRSFSDHGIFRGQLFSTQLKQKLSRHFSHRINAEAFVPGNYYSSNRDDTAVFVRYEIVLNW